MKILLIAVVLLMTGCALTESMTQEDKDHLRVIYDDAIEGIKTTSIEAVAAVGETVITGVSEAADTVIDANLPKEVADPIKDAKTYLEGLVNVLLLGWMGKRGYSSIKSGEKGKLVG